jgi:hypothetical protein
MKGKCTMSIPLSIIMLFIAIFMCGVGIFMLTLGITTIVDIIKL